VYQLSALTP